MNRDLYLEFASRSGEFQFRQRLLSLPATVGRSLQNDFVLDDPYVAASHIEISANPDDSGELLIRDLGSRNGLFLDDRRVQLARVRPGQMVRLGHTTLRVRSPDEAVAPERIDAFASQAFSLSAGTTLVALIALIAIAQTPLNQFNEISAKIWMVSVLGPLGLVVGWSALWAMLTRLFSGRAQFGAHLAIAAWTVLGIELSSQLIGLTAFALSQSWLAQAITPISFALVGWALFRHLSLAQLRWPQTNRALALVLLALPLSLWMISNWEARRSLLGDPLVTTTYFPALRLVSGQSPDDFVAAIGKLRPAVDAQAADEQETGTQDDDEFVEE